MAGSRSKVDELAARLVSMAREEARRVSPPVTRGKVRSPDPLIVELADGVLLEDGDPDVEVERRLLGPDRPAVGDTVRVHHDGQDWIVGGVVD